MLFLHPLLLPPHRFPLPVFFELNAIAGRPRRSRGRIIDVQFLPIPRHRSVQLLFGQAGPTASPYAPRSRPRAAPALVSHIFGFWAEHDPRRRAQSATCCRPESGIAGAASSFPPTSRCNPSPEPAGPARGPKPGRTTPANGACPIASDFFRPSPANCAAPSNDNPIRPAAFGLR